MKHLIGGISSAGRALPDVAGQGFSVLRSQGPWLWDNLGERYLDTAMGFGATMLGHAHPQVVEAVCHAVGNGPMPSFAHAQEEQAAAALARFTGPLSQVVFVNTGSEAVHLASRVARAATGRRQLAKFAAGYDGWFDAVAFGNAGGGDAAMAGPRPRQGDLWLLRYNDFDDAERLFRDCPDLAAVIVEPVLANAGCVPPAPGYLKHLSDVAHRHGALIILDEVLMGFRLQAGLAGTMLGAEADIATVGKAIGSGMPVAAVLGKPEVMAVFTDGRATRAGTYNGAPPACAAVIATLAQLQQQDYAALLAAGDTTRERIVQAFADHGQAVCSSGYGTVFSLWPGSQAPANYAQATALADPHWAGRLHAALRAQKVMSMPFVYGRSYLTFAHGQAELDTLVQAYWQAAAALAQPG
ncbi:aminotransferase class III-fold pyridoxal phosphate-dependent enzyme [Pseudomonas typographi]|uniref:aminotransferase class III-fold pyridoxal phosphate-dependent enzyme n=1 Tax=Pseudomonas typographi TaxID=2715964 RepID=UPI001686D8D5|nr:aminotransferase class III-fold pyridoxal phosphate-dependent enzyme [Pseudomonas typographi]MBD1551385.1 aminotransferase class III-fold pyridoxal phosphate-dependent enzyme [Pseudomonas typographi]